jgi:arylsulfatase A-like enzyme
MLGRGWLALGLVAGITASVDVFLPHDAPVPAPGAVRLVDLYRPEAVEGRVAPSAAPARIEWRFAEDGDQRWRAGFGVADLSVRNGRLTGRATAAVPILAVELPPVADSEVVHEIQVRMRASEGTQVAATLRGPAPVDFRFEAELIRPIPWPLTSPAMAGEEMQSYALGGSSAVLMRGRRHLLLRPTDREGATFEIESVRLVTRREHLAAVASGVGWQALSEVYRESLVARAPETMRFRVRLPRRPRLELAVGTIEEWPVRFRVGVRANGRDETVALRTVTAANRWEPLAVELARFAGREVTLSLALESGKDGVLGLWGSPVVRDRTAPPAAAGRPAVRGVILVWADTLRRDRLDAYGHSRPTAPNVRALAEEGVRFTDCQAQASWTKASGPSILTSLYPTTHGVADIPDRLPAAATTIAESFREAGWATFGLASIAFVGRMTNLHQGFEEFHEQTSIPSREGGVHKTSPVLVDRLLPWLDAHRDVPFFALLHVSDPHSPFRPAPPYDTLWADPALREEHERQEKAVRPFIAEPNMRRFGMPTREEMARAGVDSEPYVAYEQDLYDGAIRGMDAEIGRVRERIAALGMEDRVVIAFISDHGEAFLEHGMHFHGNSVYGELTNVPLIFWGPAAVARGRVVDGPVQLIDVMPTLLDLAGVRPPAGLQGRSLAPALRAGAGPVRLEPRPAISEKHARKGSSTEDVASTAIVSGRWKLIHNTERPAGTPEFELYDHSGDPLDLTDVAPRHPEVVARLSREIAAWRAMAAAARLKPDSDAAATLGKEELEKLRALGYIQ